MVRFCIAILVAVVLGFHPGLAFCGEGHLVLGGADDSDAVIFYPRQVEEGPDGNLYVLDTGDSYIKVFSPSGIYLRKLAGPGEGPGEFQRVDGATFGFTSSDELYFTEIMGGHNWISVLDLDGDLVKVVPLQLGVLFGVEGAISINGGGFIAQVCFNSKSRRQKNFYLYDTPRSLVEIDSTGAVVSEIVHTEYTGLISYLPNGATTNLPYTPTFTWALAGAGQVVWSDGMSPVLQVLEYSGKMIREVNSPLPQPLPVSKQDLDEWRTGREESIASRNSEWWNRFGRVIEEYDAPLYDRPILRRISITPAGNWLVEGSGYLNSEGKVFWLLDSRGSLLCRVPAAAWGARISERFLLFFAYGEDDLPMVHAIDRRGGDVETLGLLENF